MWLYSILPQVTVEQGQTSGAAGACAVCVSAA